MSHSYKLTIQCVILYSLMASAAAGQDSDKNLAIGAKIASEYFYPNYVSSAKAWNIKQFSWQEPTPIDSLDEFKARSIHYMYELPTILVNTSLLVYNCSAIPGSPSIIIANSEDTAWILSFDFFPAGSDSIFDINKSISSLNDILQLEAMNRHYSGEDALTIFSSLYKMMEIARSGGLQILREWTDIAPFAMSDLIGGVDKSDSLGLIYRSQIQSDFDSLKKHLPDSLKSIIYAPYVLGNNDSLTLIFFLRTSNGFVHRHEVFFLEGEFEMMSNISYGKYAEELISID